MNASDWIIENLEHPEVLESNTLNSLGNFTMMWAIFEASEGEERNNMLGQITLFSNRIAEHAPVTLIDEEFSYWKDRYIANGEQTNKFRHLRLSDARQEELLLTTLSSEHPTFRDKLESCLLIVYRYRNNMFHGMKDVRKLNDQKNNFLMATSLLQKVLPFGRAYWLGFPQL
ncbi:hypothetical protein [Shewanella sp. ENK2]|uniref:hypothetical protein n=1 Tax=Shewanella sp. ENK2 TaxID=2775245 RepID=UPI003749025D